MRKQEDGGSIVLTAAGAGIIGWPDAAGYTGGKAACNVLAQTAAFNFLLASRRDYADAFARYLRLSKHGGEMVWTDLLAEAGFTPPFVPGALGSLAAEVEALLGELRV